MKTYFTKSIIVAAGLLAALPAAFAAPGDPVTQVRGTVTAVDANAKTLTIQARRATTTSVLKLTDATKYYVDGTGALTDIKAGDTIRVMGQPAGTTVTATRITVIPAEEASLPAPAGRGGAAGAGGAGGAGGAAGAGGAGGGRGGFGGGRGGVQGVVASVSPLTITLADKSTDTVTTDATTTVTVPKPGTIADVKAQGNVSALTTGTADAATATEVHVQAAFGGGRGGAGGGQGAAGGAGGGRRRGGNGGGAGGGTGAGGAAPAGQ